MDPRTSQDILRRVREIQEKRANDPATAAQAVQSGLLRQDALNDLGKITLTSLGVGAGARGLMGIMDLIHRNTKPRKTYSGPAVVQLPYPVEPGETRKAEPEKVAGIGDFLAGMPRRTGEFLAGRDATTKEGIPWYLPAAMTVGMGGLATGWHGVDKLLDERRKGDVDTDLDAARQHFNEALLGQYSKPLKAKDLDKKGADADSLGHDLDRLYDAFQEKSASWGDMAGQLAGAYGVYAAPAALFTGMMAYQSAAKKQQMALLNKALQRRQRRRFMQSPPEVYATPVPVEVGADKHLHPLASS